MRIHILGNKYAGSGNALRIMEEIKHLLDGYEVTSSFTEKNSENFINYIEKNSDIKYLITVGGDGTVNYAIQAVAGKNVILIPVSAGTGSDLARTTGRVKISEIPNIISVGKSKRIDLGLIHINGKSRYFINIMEAGLGGMVMVKVNSIKHRTGLTFIYAILSGIIRIRPIASNIIIDNESLNEKIIDIIIANGQYYGKGIHASPDSIMDDGFFNVHIIKYMPKIRIFSKLLSLRNGTYIDDSYVINRKAKQINVICNSLIEIDGETENASSFTVEMCHNMLELFQFP
ncbi:diacylglycerol kinase family protein [Ferroplasma sp.]|uniref:diacylglycerol/lipid kinase family protein n=1 Tax=Ferroplasma sp. TaxID=2591003 RepID=UPI00307D3F4A